jgi:hypothetical protein
MEWGEGGAEPTLMGMPVLFTEHDVGLGTVDDIILADFGGYFGGSPGRRTCR